ncbi:MAG: ABC transporter ATP-binding protein [bacterium]|nr:ABC transporter ATP-binding protein [bacterium]
MPPSDPLMTVSSLRYGFPERPDFLGPMDMRVASGELLVIVGPNGAGKTTLLRLLAGVNPPQGGSVLLEGRELADLTPRVRARRVAYLPQKPPADLAVSSLDVVLMGRFPHRGYSLFETASDLAVCREAMRLAQTESLEHRRLDTLSGGEAQRVHLAAALAQEPDLLVLDEPTASLDLFHQLAVFRLLVSLTRRRGMGCVVVTHDLNLASRYADRVVLLSAGSIVAVGRADDVLTDEVLSPVYGVRFSVQRIADDGRPWIIPVDEPAPREEIRP